MQQSIGMPGFFELLVLGIVCTLTIGVPVLIIAIVLWSKRKNRQDS